MRYLRLTNGITIQKDGNNCIQNIKENEQDIDIDIKGLNGIIEQMKKGDYSLNLEDYE